MTKEEIAEARDRTALLRTGALTGNGRRNPHYYTYKRGWDDCLEFVWHVIEDREILKALYDKKPDKGGV